ncbi:MAG TPA: ATP-binding protein [Solirubrobacteraceae bacterium]|nr:ATP-binding protein [Solirubrobacteraceae bacterium]
MEIAFCGRAVARFGGTIALVGAPIRLVAFTRRIHPGQPRPGVPGRQPSRDARASCRCAGHPLGVASASWSIPALADEVIGIRQAALQFPRGHGVPDHRLADQRLAISEAVSNAVIHAFRARGTTPAP